MATCGGGDKNKTGGESAGMSCLPAFWRESDSALSNVGGCMLFFKITSSDLFFSFFFQIFK